MRNTQLRGQQSGFTLIELVVVIVILGILAATALPRFADMSTDARVAKMQAAEAAMKTAVSLTHAQWLVKGSPAGTNDADSGSATTNTVKLEGVSIPFRYGYPDVGGDGADAAKGTTIAEAKQSGIMVAAGGLADYEINATSPALSATTLTIFPDAAHSDNAAGKPGEHCFLTYTEATATTGPTFVKDYTGC